mgnify:CR=1 FL=1
MSKRLDSRHDFPEDFEHENGMYMNKCCHCQVTFLGYKRRVSCKVCDTLSKEKISHIEEAVRREMINPFFTEKEQLEIAIGSVTFREKVILNLREQIKNLRSLLHDSEIDDIIIDQHQFKHIRGSDD